MKGFRVPPQPSKKEAMAELKAEFASLQMAGRVSQMMTKQLMQNVKTMSEDLSAALNQLYDLQYKYGAAIKLLNLDKEELNKAANEQRLVDFNEASVKQDVKDNMVTADSIGVDSTVVITSVAKDEQGNDQGIFRSRLKLSESGAPDLIKGLEGKKVGDKVTTKLNGLDHEVEVLSIRNPAPVAVTPETEH